MVGTLQRGNPAGLDSAEALKAVLPALTDPSHRSSPLTAPVCAILEIHGYACNCLLVVEAAGMRVRSQYVSRKTCHGTLRILYHGGKPPFLRHDDIQAAHLICSFSLRSGTRRKRPSPSWIHMRLSRYQGSELRLIPALLHVWLPIHLAFVFPIQY